MKCSLGISSFLEDLSSLSQSIVFLYLFAVITEEDFLISPCCSFKLCIQMGISLPYYNYMYGEGDGTPLQYSCLENPVD